MGPASPTCRLVPLRADLPRPDPGRSLRFLGLVARPASRRSAERGGPRDDVSDAAVAVLELLWDSERFPRAGMMMKKKTKKKKKSRCESGDWAGWQVGCTTLSGVKSSYRMELERS